MRGQCAACGRVMNLKADGTLRHHADKSRPMDGPWRPRCEGSGYPPRREKVEREKGKP